MKSEENAMINPLKLKTVNPGGRRGRGRGRGRPWQLFLNSDHCTRGQ